MVEPLKKTDGQVLAEPVEEAKKRSAMLMQSIKRACEKNDGRIRFSEFMNIALYEPGLGYYSGGLQKFGASGDFITAPEVSPLFGQCLANQLAEIFGTFSEEADRVVIEFGAGSGVLAVDILRRLDLLNTLPEKYLILELSAELQHRQKQLIKDNLPHLYDRVSWLDKLPENLSHAVVIANEVLDAMPVDCFRIGEDAAEAMMVKLDGAGDLQKEFVADKEVTEMLATISQRSSVSFEKAYTSEVNPAIHGWLSALESQLQTAVILLIDYGYNEQEYYHPDRTDGTLMCYYQHKAHDDFFWWPGLQDITAFVNFTDIAYNADDIGMQVAGYTTQAAFLLANGLSELHEEQVTDDVRQQVKLSQQIKTLTLPSEMGDRFKVMALTKNYDEPLTGFLMLDLRNRL